MAEKEISQEIQEEPAGAAVPEKVAAVLDEIKAMSPEDRACLGVSMVKHLSVLELSGWVKALEKEFGVSAAAAVPAGAAAGGAAQPEGQAQEAAKDSFNVVLTAAGDKKIQVIKEVRAITGLGLKEAKALVDEAPKPVKENATEEEANEIKSKLEAAGASVELK